MTAVEHDDSVGDFVGAGHVVGDDDARDVEFLSEFEDEFVDDVAADGVESGGGLIVEDDFGVEGDGSGEGNAFSLSAGEVSGFLGLNAVEADHAEFFGHDALDLFDGEGGVFDEGEGDVFGDGKGVEQGAHLEEEAEVFTHVDEIAFFFLINALAFVIHFALVGPEQADDVLEEDAFAGTGFADDHRGLSRAQGKADALEHFEGAELLGNVSQFDNGLDGCSGHGTVSFARHGSNDGLETPKARINGQEQVSNEKVECENDDKDGDEGLGACSSDAFGAVAAGEAFVAADQSDAPAEEDALEDAGEHVPSEDVDGRVFPVGARGDVVDADGDEPAGHRTHEVAIEGEDGGQEQASEESGRDEVSQGVGAHAPEGVDLFGDLHGAEFGGEGSADPSGQHEPGEDGSEFTDEGEVDEQSEAVFEADGFELGDGLNGQCQPDKDAGDHDDGDAAVADLLELGHEES